MKFRTLLPDELFLGYVGHIRAANFLLPRTRLIDRLGPLRGQREGSVRRSCEFSAVIDHLSLDPLEVVRRHTLVPLTKSVSWEQSEEPRPFGQFVYYRFAMSAAPAGRVCRDCILEDELNGHPPYWRRLHQIAGVNWCGRHMRPLTSTLCNRRLSLGPVKALEDAIDLTREDVDPLMRAPVVTRYLDVVERLLALLDRPLEAAKASWTLRRRAESLGIKLNGKQSLELLIRQVTPGGWLSESFPDSVQRIPSESSWIDRITYSHIRCRPETFALATALLWDDPGEAVEALVLGTVERPNPRCRFPRGCSPEVVGEDGGSHAKPSTQNNLG
ncbi:TniQ family protein [Pseudorhodoferax sp. Leaf274]|uniref:TniQ family protein n=1 Tax=Pseudorhodoferax sp. Leaf274 TaxID=1736318 RepID=UPI0009EB79BF